MASDFCRRRADELCREGRDLHLKTELPVAITRYTQAIALNPTAEAHTLRGWALSLLGQLDEAIRECEAAIAIDPSYGNPYNDIGSYLLKLGRLDEATEWLEKAKVTPRCTPPHFPHMNLGRVYARRGMVLRAMQEFEGALELCPDEPICIAALRQLKESLS